MNYNSLMNKPTINYRELIGDNTVTEVGGITEEQFNALLNTDLSSYYTKAQIDELFARSYVFRDKSGGVVTFDCPTSTPAFAQILSEIAAVQSGTGDPSPTNVRPFSGWSAVNVYDTSINLLGGTALVDAIHATMPSAPVDTTEETISFNGSTDTSANKVISDSVVFKPNTQYTFINIGTTGVKGNFRWLYTDNTYDAAVDVVIGAYVSKANKSVKALIKINNSNQNTVLKYNTCGIFEGAITTDDFVAYNGTTYTTTLKDGQGDPLTCYGGGLMNAGGSQALIVTDGHIASYNGETLPSTWLSDRDVYAAGTTPTIGAEVVYKLETPQQITQDSLSIVSTGGVNNIWCDSGDITVRALDKIIQG